MPEGIQYDCTPCKIGPATTLRNAYHVRATQFVGAFLQSYEWDTGYMEIYIYIYIFIIIWNQELSKNGESRRKKTWTMEESVS